MIGSGFGLIFVSVLLGMLLIQPTLRYSAPAWLDQVQVLAFLAGITLAAIGLVTHLMAVFP
jgi:hypothetical protein